MAAAEIVFLHVQQKFRQRRALDRAAFLGLHDVVFGRARHQLVVEFVLVADVAVHLAALHAIQRRLRDVDVLALDQLGHVAEEKREQQRADVAAVHVRVGHQNDFVIAQLGDVEIVLADARAERRDDGANFLVAQHLVVARFFDVENFSLERQDGLVFAVAPALGRAAGRLALDDEQLAARRIALLAIGEFSRQAARIHGGFAPRQLARLAGGFAGARGVNALADDAPRHGRVLVEIFAQALVDQLLDGTLDVAVQFSLGLALELRLRQFHGNDRDESFAHVVAGDGDFVLLLLEHVRGRSEIVDRARQRRAEAGKVRPAVHRVDRVGEGKNIFRVAVVVLQRDFDFDRVALAFHVDRRIVQHLLALVQVLDEFGDAAGETELGGFVAALVGQRDFQALVQEGELAQALRQNVVAVFVALENRGIGMKRDFRAGLARFPGDSSAWPWAFLRCRTAPTLRRRARFPVRASRKARSPPKRRRRAVRPKLCTCRCRIFRPRAARSSRLPRRAFFPWRACPRECRGRCPSP